MVRTALFASMTLVLAPSALASSAQAQTFAMVDPALTETQMLDVRYDDLNLASARGVATLDRRIARAADTVCGTADIRDLNGSRMVKACKASAILGAGDARRLAIAATSTRMAAR